MHSKSCPHDCNPCSVMEKVRDGLTYETAILFYCKKCNKVLSENWCCGTWPLNLKRNIFYAWEYSQGIITVAPYECFVNGYGHKFGEQRVYDTNFYLEGCYLNETR